jgi:hypothetical protein
MHDLGRLGYLAIARHHTNYASDSQGTRDDENEGDRMGPRLSLL